jgi:hypothetical protein
MKPFAIALIAGLAAALSFLAVSQPMPSPAQTVPAAPSQELPKTYVPGLGEFMGRIQVDHAKLWLAGEARNWQLAEYQLTELKEVFSDVQDLVPRYQNLPVGDMIDAIITGTVNDLEKAIGARDFGKFSAGFDKHATPAIKPQIVASSPSSGRHNRTSAIRISRQRENEITAHRESWSNRLRFSFGNVFGCESGAVRFRNSFEPPRVLPAAEKHRGGNRSRGYQSRAMRVSLDSFTP